MGDDSAGRGRSAVFAEGGGVDMVTCWERAGRPTAVVDGGGPVSTDLDRRRCSVGDCGTWEVVGHRRRWSVGGFSFDSLRWKVLGNKHIDEGVSGGFIGEGELVWLTQRMGGRCGATRARTTRERRTAADDEGTVDGGRGVTRARGREHEQTRAETAGVRFVGESGLGPTEEAVGMEGAREPRGVVRKGWGWVEVVAVTTHQAALPQLGSALVTIPPCVAPERVLCQTLGIAGLDDRRVQRRDRGGARS
ncbi:hypothetical protein FPV67DRAFT_1459680 [Lyophyllum atratum]|nr:hypothetical protein FPV67DRAFT_1459680 [Lyophyllum atratum]